MGIDVILVPDRAVNVCKQQLAGLCSPSVILLTAYLLQKITIKSTVPHPAYTYSQTDRQRDRQVHIHIYMHKQTHNTYYFLLQFFQYGQSLELPSKLISTHSQLSAGSTLGPSYSKVVFKKTLP